MRFIERRNSDNPAVPASGKPLLNRNIGLTLIELLIVTMMLAVISLTIYTVFSNGIKIWNRINQEMPQEELNIFFDKFSGDMINAFSFKNISFTGKDEEMSFATFIDSQKLQARTVGKVHYFFDRENGVLKREEMDFSDIYREEIGKTQKILHNIKALKFYYYVYEAEKNEYLWKDEWDKDHLPLAARIELEIMYGDQIGKFTKTVSIPVSS